jgi:hypothetical protein
MDERTKPLLEWNRLARENTENAIVSSMFSATLKASEPLESFSNWLLLGTAATASFFIVNGDKLVPVITKQGFFVCGSFLVLSAVFGLLSRLLALRCRIALEIGTAIRATFEDHLAKYEAEEEKIQAGAKFWGINLETGIRIDRVLAEFLKPFPSWARWMAWRHLRNNEENPQIQHVSPMRSLNAQGMAAFLQGLLYVGFLAAGFVYAAAS